MRINLVIELLGHNFMLGLGAGMEKAEPDHPEVAELHSETQIAGFRRRDDHDEDDDNFEDRRIVGFTRNVRTA